MILTINYGGLLFISSLLITLCDGQNQALRYINSGTNPPMNSPPQFTSIASDDEQLQWRNLGTRFANANQICVRGLWALYNTTNYGEGVEQFTTVISVRGTDLITQCTRPGQIPILRNVQSLQYFGHRDISMNGLVIYSQAYYLGARWDVTVTQGPEAAAAPLPDQIRGFPLGSLAITGSRTWLICGDTACTSAMCVNAENYGNLFLQRNTAQDNNWPRIVRRVRIVNAATAATECFNFPTPPPLNPQRKLRREVSEGIEISIYEAS